MEWKEYKFTDISILIGGGTPKTSIPAYWGGDIPWLSVKDFCNDNKYVYTTEKTITEIGLAQSSTKLLHKGDIIISARGTIGEIAMLASDMAFNQSCFGIRSNGIVGQDYLYYLTKTKINELKKNSHGSVFETITKDTFASIKCLVPSLDDQKKIASILSSLDAKIENNNKINANLEAQAQALFKSWFVDFEPFQNGEFEDSELGRIPKGWKVGTYSDIIEGTISGDWGKESKQGNYTHSVACIRGCDFQDINQGIRGKTPERYILEKNYVSKHLKDKDIIVEISGGTQTVSTGRVCLVSDDMLQKYNYDLICTNFCRVVRPLIDYSAYIYYSWLFKYNGKVMFGYENGTSGIKNFQINDFLTKELLIIPPVECSLQFQNIINTLQKAIQTNGTESTTLSHLRDTLLPKLMSGEIEV